MEKLKRISDILIISQGVIVFGSFQTEDMYPLQTPVQRFKMDYSEYKFFENLVKAELVVTNETKGIIYGYIYTITLNPSWKGCKIQFVN